MKCSKKFLAGMVALGFLFAPITGKCDAAMRQTGGISMKETTKITAAGGNPFGLVYENAVTENFEGKVQIHPVTYALNGIEIVANIYTPANYASKKLNSYAAVVVAHPNGGVKEQVAGLYAQRLAELGYVAIAADAAYQGASGGEPRLIDRPANRIEDIRGMVDAISSYPGVDASRIGALGICGGGGYTLAAAQTDKRIGAVATLSMFNSGEVRRNGFKNSQMDSISERMKQAAEARAKEAAGAPVQYTPNMLDKEIPEEELAKMPDLYSDGYRYYGKTHRHPNSTFSYALSCNLDLALFDAADRMDMINQPLLMMAGDKADTLYMTERCYNAATGTKDKELFLISGARHITTYYVPEYVEQIVDKLKAFYGKNL